MKPFIPKITKGMPNAYSITFTYSNGEKEEMELVWHLEDKNEDKFRFSTSKDTRGWIVLSLIVRIELDARFSKIKELETQELKKK